MDEGEPASGVRIGNLSAPKNKRIIATAGGILLAVGIAGLILASSQIITKVTTQGFSSPDEGKAAQRTEYVFLFTMLGGLILLIYAGVSYQREKAKIRDSRTRPADAA
jgi:hypothetical protein